MPNSKAGSVSPSPSPSSDSSQRNDADLFLLLRDLRPGEIVRKKPPVFEAGFRLARQMACRTVPRYGVLREGRLYVYLSKEDAKENRTWRTIDLGESAVSYRSRDSRLLITVSKRYRLKIKDKADFQRWVDSFRKHRLYAQAKAANAIDLFKDRPRKKVVVILPPAALPPPPPAVEPPPEQIAELKPITEQSWDGRSVGKKPSLSKPPLTLPSAASLATEQQRSPKKAVSPVSVSPPPRKVPRPILPRKQATIPASKDRGIFALAKQTKSADESPAAAESPASPAPAKLEVFLKESEEVPAGQSPVAAPQPSTPTSSIVSSPQQPAAQGATPAAARVKEPQADIVIEEQKSGGESGAESVEQKSSDHSGDQSGAGMSDLRVSGRSVPPFRTKLPSPMAPQPSLFKLIMSAIGKDVMRMALPASVMEPLSALQMLCEELEYSDLLDTALTKMDPQWRMMCVAAFAMSRYGATAKRANRKPFNPLLGETFEFVHPRLGWRFLAEQVSHHPPVAASFVEGRGWRMWQDCELIASLSATAVKATPLGVIHVRLEQWGETYQWSKVVSQVTGILSGNYVIHHMGDMVISCPQTGLACKLTFKKTTSQRRGDVSGQLLDENDRVLHRMYGNWMEKLYIGDPGEGNAVCVWRLSAMPLDYDRYYGFTKFAMGLNEMRPDIHGKLPPTDTRFRPDQRALENGKVAEADKIKRQLEERQRQRRKANEAKKVAHKPLWFGPTGNTNPAAGPRWEFKGRYWKAKENFKDIDFPDLW